MRSVLNLCGAHKLLVLRRELVVHGVARHKSGGTKWHSHLLIRAVVIDEGLLTTAGNTNCEECSDNRGSKTVQSSVDVPSVEPGEIKVLLIRNGSGVECAMMRMSELDVL